MNYKKGDIIIDISNNKVYTIKYLIGSTIVVASGKGYDMPIPYKYILPHSSLIKELM
jgi:hypothetical protein